VPDDIKITVEPQGVGFRWDGGLTDQQKRIMTKVFDRIVDVQRALPLSGKEFVMVFEKVAKDLHERGELCSVPE